MFNLVWEKHSGFNYTGRLNGKMTYAIHFKDFVEERINHAGKVISETRGRLVAETYDDEGNPREIFRAQEGGGIGMLFAKTEAYALLGGAKMGDSTKRLITAIDDWQTDNPSKVIDWDGIKTKMFDIVVYGGTFIMLATIVQVLLT